MNCREVIDFLMEYLDDELPENVKMCFDMHLEMCPPCVEYLRTYKHTILVAKGCCKSAPSACDEIPEALVQAILAARKARPGK